MHFDSLTRYCLHLHTYQPGVQYEGKMVIVRLEATQCIRPVAAMAHEASLQGAFGLSGRARFSPSGPELQRIVGAA